MPLVSDQITTLWPGLGVFVLHGVQDWTWEGFGISSVGRHDLLYFALHVINQIYKSCESSQLRPNHLCALLALARGLLR